MIFKIYLEKSDEGGYTVTVPSLPGCISEGDTKEYVTVYKFFVHIIWPSLLLCLSRNQTPFFNNLFKSFLSYNNKHIRYIRAGLRRISKDSLTAGNSRRYYNAYRF